jgi:hypothetical protein
VKAAVGGARAYAAAVPASAAGRLERACGRAERILLRLRPSPNASIVVRGTFGFLKQLLRSRALERSASRSRG